MTLRRFFALALCPALLTGLVACQSAVTPPVSAPLPALTIGVAPFTQPERAVELLAGYVPEQQNHVATDTLLNLDDQFRDMLLTTNRSYVFLPRSSVTGPLAEDARGRRSALATWVERARNAGVDLIIVPQIIDWHERVGGEAGVVSPAAVMADIYLIDARADENAEGALLQRVHYAEQQQALTSNLLSIGSFFRRGGKWVSADDLAREAMQRAVKEFGL